MSLCLDTMGSWNKHRPRTQVFQICVEKKGFLQKKIPFAFGTNTEIVIFNTDKYTYKTEIGPFSLF